MNMNETRNIVEKYGFKFTKSLGQNFLTDSSVLDDIIKGAEVTKEDFIIEIGPGVGTLTRRLLDEAKFVVSVELDSELIGILNEEFKDSKNFKLVHGDALKLDYNEYIKDEKHIKLVANLPYYITTPIIVRLLSEEYKFKSLTVMIQKEVADRIAAKPNCKEYGALSVFVQYYCSTKIIRKVSPASFIPRPKVDSVIIRLDRLSDTAIKVKDEKLFFQVVRCSFNMRRKTIWNALKSLKIDGKLMQDAFQNSEINPQRRGETLSLVEFGNLSDEIYNLMESKKV